jgi:hypothetical protein
MGYLTSLFDVDRGHLFAPATSLAEIFLSPVNVPGPRGGAASQAE